MPEIKKPGLRSDQGHKTKPQSKKIYDPIKDDPKMAFGQALNDLEVYLCSVKLESSKAKKMMQYAKDRLET